MLSHQKKQHRNWKQTLPHYPALPVIWVPATLFVGKESLPTPSIFLHICCWPSLTNMSQTSHYSFTGKHHSSSYIIHNHWPSLDIQPVWRQYLTLAQSYPCKPIPSETGWLSSTQKITMYWIVHQPAQFDHCQVQLPKGYTKEEVNWSEWLVVTSCRLNQHGWPQLSH